MSQMSPTHRKPRGRHDTKSLVRLGGEFVEEPRTSDVAPRHSGTQLRDAAPRDSAAGEEVDGLPQERAQRESEPVQKVDARIELELWFAGRQDTVRARGELIGDTLQLKTALPLFELGSETRFALADSTQEPGRARVRRVEIMPGPSQSIPELCVELTVVEPAAEARASSADATTGRSFALDAEAEPFGDEDTDADALPASVGAGRVTGVLGAGIVGLVCGAGAMFGWLQHVELARPLTSQKLAVSALVAKPVVPAPAPLQLFDAVPLAARVSGDRAPEAEPPSLLAYEELPASVAIARAAPEVLAAVVPIAEPAPEPSSAPPTASSSAPLPQVTLDGARTQLLIPMQGSAEGLHAYALTTPGVTFTLPRARPLIPLGNHAIGRGLVRRVWLRKAQNGSEVRVIFRRPGVRYATAFGDAGLLVTLDRPY